MKDLAEVNSLKNAIEGYYQEPEKKPIHSDGELSILEALKVQFPIEKSN
jgi:hypothetical protein